MSEIRSDRRDALDATPQTVLAERPAGPMDPVAPRSVRAVVHADAVIRALEAVATPGGAVRLDLRPAALEVTTHQPDAGCWTAAVVPVVERPAPLLRAGAQVRAGALTELLRGNAELTFAFADGRLRAGAHLVPRADAIVPALPRPSAAGLVRERVTLPQVAHRGVTLRLPGVTVWVPEPVRRTFAGRRISLVALHEREGAWLLSGVADGDPMVVVVGAVEAY